ncbi:hypothetical protein DFJ58DRAFT_847612 [Suillus subalutaceus]|uniref:uncharacterized protein n=1 Tax=Suillus subalutaceus TaxID=48586 RepID=UPI001B8776B3|nr:uncharacterized protein DFJ58DRAFT_847612 [Suillus subalutaceus]KAG1834365.1 hypothetical protein DFJ58DRAFT_847612 [Suillus subalutaceus]
MDRDELRKNERGGTESGTKEKSGEWVLIDETNKTELLASGGLDAPLASTSEATESMLPFADADLLTDEGSKSDDGEDRDLDCLSSSAVASEGPLTTERIFSSFFNVVSTALLALQPDLAHTRNLSRTWSAANSSRPHQPWRWFGAADILVQWVSAIFVSTCTTIPEGVNEGSSQDIAPTHSPGPDREHIPPPVRELTWRQKPTEDNADEDDGSFPVELPIEIPQDPLLETSAGANAGRYGSPLARWIKQWNIANRYIPYSHSRGLETPGDDLYTNSAQSTSCWPRYGISCKFRRKQLNNANVLHRDCSLFNAMIEYDGNGTHGMLIDWGVCREDLEESELHCWGHRHITLHVPSTSPAAPPQDSN